LNWEKIYTFPIFPESSKSGPTINDLNNNFKDSDKPLPELAVYGAHLNRYTFLKVNENKFVSELILLLRDDNSSSFQKTTERQICRTK